MNTIHQPWLDWQKTGMRRNGNAYELRACPFCDSLSLSLQLSFNNTAARVECRDCLAEGPWSWSHDPDAALHDAVEAWNGYCRTTRSSKRTFDLCPEQRSSDEPTGSRDN